MTGAVQPRPPRVAIVIEWLTLLGGAEMVLREMLQVFPEADLFALLDTLPEPSREALGLTGRRVTTTWMQHVPNIGRWYRGLLPLMPLAARSHDLRDYDVVISSAYAVAHHVRVAPGAVHLVYCHTPIRYAWELRDRYLEDAGLDRGVRGWLARRLLDWIQRGDARAAQRPHSYAVNSRYVAGRVLRHYGREATVIWPPADIEYFTPGAVREDFYVAASRMVPYKKIPLIAQAFSQHLPQHRLVIIGDGPDMPQVRAAAGPNVQVLGAQPRDILRNYLRRARAFVFAAQEDFGILPVEAQACGTPVLAYGVGGAQETVVDGETGLFFWEQTPEAVAQVVRRSETRSFDPERCRANAERFAVPRFREQLLAWVALHAPGVLTGR
ncbi:MAG: glycosyltransferase [Gemmatimonadetes bacterium]|nr:glycosyltransferase [Gemmatimonadota bacterium]